MAAKKEIQKQIIEKTNNGFKVSEEEFLSVLRSVAPGTNFRAALDGALRVGKGALIVIENDYTFSLLDGGFRINAKFTPQKLIELTKMDGAIILSKDFKKINFANVLLTPSSEIMTHETGTRHKAAERTAKQAGTLAIAISERKNEITLYYKNVRYPLMQTEEILRRANEHIQLLEKQKELFDKSIERLTQLEFRNYFNLKQAIIAIQKGKFIQKIAADLRKYSIELGKEGTLLKIRLKEITSGVEKETDLIVKDYTQMDLKKSKMLLEELSYDDILNEEIVCRILNYENPNVVGKIAGWRIISKTSLSESEIALLVLAAQNLESILNADENFFEGLFPNAQAKSIREELDKMKRSFSF